MGCPSERGVKVPFRRRQRQEAARCHHVAGLFLAQCLPRPSIRACDGKSPRVGAEPVRQRDQSGEERDEARCTRQWLARFPCQRPTRPHGIDQRDHMGTGVIVAHRHPMIAVLHPQFGIEIGAATQFRQRPAVMRKCGREMLMRTPCADKVAQHRGGSTGLQHGMEQQCGNLPGMADQGRMRVDPRLETAIGLAEIVQRSQHRKAVMVLRGQWSPRGRAEPEGPCTAG